MTVPVPTVVDGSVRTRVTPASEAFSRPAGPLWTASGDSGGKNRWASIRRPKASQRRGSRASRPRSIRSTRYGTLQGMTTEALIPATARAVAVSTPGMNAAVKSSGRRTMALITVPFWLPSRSMRTLGRVAWNILNGRRCATDV